MARHNGKMIEVQISKPVNEYMGGLGAVTIIPSLHGASVYIEDQPDRKMYGSVRDCLKQWADGRREDITKQMIAVQEVERVVRLMDEIREAKHEAV